MTRSDRKRIVVGEYRNRNTGLFTENGTAVSQFKVPIRPWYISANSLDHLDVSGDIIIIVDINKRGKKLFTLNAPPGDQNWDPEGARRILEQG